MAEQFDSHYFTGQGPVFIAERNAASGAHLGFDFAGDMPQVSIDASSTPNDVRENVTGQRNIASSLAGETTFNINLTFRSSKAEHIKARLQGDLTTKVAGSVTDEDVNGYHDKFSDLANVKCSNIVVKDSTTTTTYVADTDYIAHGDEGMIEILSTGSIADAEALKVSYDYAAQKHVDVNPQDKEWMLTCPSINRRRDNKIGRLTAFKISIPPGGVNLIQDGDDADSVSVQGRVLYDDLRSAGDRLFNFAIED